MHNRMKLLFFSGLLAVNINHFVAKYGMVSLLQGVLWKQTIEYLLPFLCIFSLLLIAFPLNLILDGYLDLVMLRPKYNFILLWQCGSSGIEEVQ